MTGVTAAGFSSVVRGGFNNNIYIHREMCVWYASKKELKGGENPPDQPTQDKQHTYMYTQEQHVHCNLTHLGIV